MMNILLLGSGGREHAIAAKIAESPKCGNLYIAPGNAGTSRCGTNVALDSEDFEAIKTFVLNKNIEMLIIGPEAPLVAGISDFFANDDKLNKIAVIGPSKKGAMLEGSKDFAKSFMYKYGIPTAAYRSFSHENIEEGIAFLKTLKPPYVLKADGLAAGKGVLILHSLSEAERELKEMIENSKFGKASEKVVIEEFLEGIELSVFVLIDGKHYCILPSAKDYKRVGEGNTGLNTGGMGSISPVPFANRDFMQKVEEKIIRPSVNGIIEENMNYKGFLFFGLMNKGGEACVVEYNVRMGDPETESVFPRIKSDIVDLFEHVWTGDLDKVDLKVNPQTAACIMMVAGGYPKKYEKGKPVKGLENVKESIIFHAGTKLNENGETVTNGGRVLCLTSFADNLEEALKKSYASAAKISWDDCYYRHDIGKDLM